MKTSSPGVDLGGNCEVTFKLKVRLKSVPRLDVETSTSVWEVINFISNFEIKMRSHKVSKGDQKIYLLEVLQTRGGEGVGHEGGGQFING